MRALVERQNQIDLTKSHSGPRRVFFVGDDFWLQVRRPVSTRFAAQQVKEHGRWIFVSLQGDASALVEIPFLSWWVNRRRDRQELLSPATKSEVPRSASQLTDRN